MAIINVDDAYILNETGAQVDKTTGIPFKNESLTEAEAAQARANIRAGGSNPNLLDNAYFVGGGSQLGDGVFPINQRELTTYNSSAYSIDRWVGNCTLNAGYLTVNGFLYQRTTRYPLNVPLTFSVMLEDGTIVSGTQTITDRTTQQYFYTDGTNIQLVKTSGDGSMMIWTGSSVNIKAAKLELGTVSTLANDVPPVFSEELAKCEYRLRYIPLTRYPIAIDGSNAYLTLIGMDMASVPTPSLISAGGVRDAGGTASITSATVTGFTRKNATVQFALSASRSYVAGYIYDTVLCLSAEL